MAVVVTLRDGKTMRFDNGIRWGYDDSGNLQVVSRENAVLASFYNWENVRMVENNEPS